MLRPLYTKQFEKDWKRQHKRGKTKEKLLLVLNMLINKTSLPQKNRDHKLIGNYAGRRECHVESDWLLIYKLTKSEIIFERTGSHSDLFQ